MGHDPSPPAGRIPMVLAAVIAVIAWAGLALNAVDVFARTGSAGTTIWILLDYFTIITNVLIAVAFTGLAFRSRTAARPGVLAGLTLSILLVGVVYQLLLRGLYTMTPIAQVADTMLHTVIPVLVPLFWIVGVPKGRLTLRDPLAWALYPLAYFAYAVCRGLVTEHYPYPFMDVAKLGWERTGINAAVIALGYIATGWAMVWLDGMLAGRARPRV